MDLEFLLSHRACFLCVCASGVYTREWGRMGCRAHTYFHSVGVCWCLPNLIRLTCTLKSVKNSGCSTSSLTLQLSDVDIFAKWHWCTSYITVLAHLSSIIEEAEPHWVFHWPFILPLLGTAHSRLLPMFLFLSVFVLYSWHEPIDCYAYGQIPSPFGLSFYILRDTFLKKNLSS